MDYDEPTGGCVCAPVHVAHFRLPAVYKFNYPYLSGLRRSSCYNVPMAMTNVPCMYSEECNEAYLYISIFGYIPVTAEAVGFSHSPYIASCSFIIDIDVRLLCSILQRPN